jgi:hypothetical protein
MTKIAGIRIHWSEAQIHGSGSVPKWHGSATLVSRFIDLQEKVSQLSKDRIQLSYGITISAMALTFSFISDFCSNYGLVLQENGKKLG